MEECLKEFTERKLVSNAPNAGKTVMALRNNGYTIYSALCDIIDNSIDADASEIQIKVGSQMNNGINQLVFYIIDNGCGMDFNTLNEALRLGSDTSKLEDDLGKFGMGLSTASISIARKCTVITKQKNAECYICCEDIDEIRRVNDFVKTIDRASSREIAQVRNTIMNPTSPDGCGTVVILERCDRQPANSRTYIIEQLKKIIGQSYRFYIDKGIKFYVNNELCEKDDPLLLSIPETQVIIDKPYTFNINNIDYNIHLKMVLLPEYTVSRNAELGINVSNQGFYILRNNRQIISAQDFGFFTRHASLNRLRGELIFDSSCDDLMGINYQKQNVDINEDLKALLRQIIDPQLDKIRKIFSDRAERIRDEICDSVENEISLKFKSLNLDIFDTKKTNSHSDNSKLQNNENQVPKRKNKSRRINKLVQFKINNTLDIALYNPYIQNNKIIIELNPNHPIYKNFMTGNANKRIMALWYNLVFIMAGTDLDIQKGFRDYINIQTNDGYVNLIDYARNVTSNSLFRLFE